MMDLEFVCLRCATRVNRDRDLTKRPATFQGTETAALRAGWRVYSWKEAIRAGGVDYWLCPKHAEEGPYPESE